MSALAPIKTSAGRTIPAGVKGEKPPLIRPHAKIPKSRYLELRGEYFHCCIFPGNFTRLSTVQSYLCSD